MKFITSTMIFLLTICTIYSQERSAKRYAFNDAESLLGLTREKAYLTRIQTNPEIVNRSRSSNTRKALTAKAELFDAQQRLLENDNYQKQVLAFYFNNPQEIAAFNTKYHFHLPEDIIFNKKSYSHFSANNSTEEKLKTTSNGSAAAIDAIGTLLADRFKKEINVAFLSKFRKQLDSLPYLGDFFPLSKIVMNNSDPYNYTVFIGTLQQAFNQDLANLKVNLPGILLKSDPNATQLTAALRAVGFLLQVKDFSDFRISINAIASDSIIDSRLREFHKEAGLTAVSFNAVTKLDNDRMVFLNEEDLDKFLYSFFAHNYMALLVKQNEKYLIQAGVDIDWDFTKMNERLKMIEKIASYYLKLNQVLSNQPPDQPAITKTALIIKSALNTVNDLLKSSAQNDWSAAGVKFNKFQKVLPYAEQLSTALVYIDSKQYGLAVMNVTTVILDESGSNLTVDQKAMVKKYSGFIADVLNAEGKDELVTALDNSANPVGSYRVKRNSTFNISFNAYAGGFYGANLKGTSLFGVTAPLGIYFGWGNAGKDRPVLTEDNGSSLGFFLPIIDVGSVASFRIQDSETELADVSWDNVFSPGAYVTYGIKKCPISINIGGQMGPALKEVLSDGSPIIGEKTWFWRASIVIDIPLFDLYTKQKEYNLITPVNNKG